jgi:hypothetical protein
VPEALFASNAELVRRFEAAEARVFPLAMVDPDLYQRATLLVSELARRLAEDGADPMQVERLLARADDLLSEVAAAAGLSTRGLVRSQLVDAAFAHVYRRQLAQDVAQAEKDRVDQARARGDRWLVLAEPSSEAQLMGFMQWVELHLATGQLLYRSIEVGSDGTPRFVVETRSGEAEPSCSKALPRHVRHESGERDDWVVLCARVRAELDGFS